MSPAIIVNKAKAIAKFGIGYTKLSARINPIVPPIPAPWILIFQNNVTIVRIKRRPVVVAKIRNIRLFILSLE